MIRSLMILMAMALLLASTAQANDLLHPSRARLIAHGGHDLSEKTRLEYRFAPSANLLGEPSPMAFFGAKFKATNWLGVETYLGVAFKPNEPLVSLSLNPHFDKVYGWTAIDLREPSKAGYWFAQAEYKIFDWFHAGAEGEGWGNYEKSASWNHGGGPNLLFRFGMLGVDTAVHIRAYNGETKPEFFLRTHLFL